MNREPRRVRRRHDASRPVTIKVESRDFYDPEAARVVVREATGRRVDHPRRTRCSWPLTGAQASEPKASERR